MTGNASLAMPDAPLDSASPWSRLDTVLLTAVTALAGALRLVHITRPNGFVFDEFYASDACLYLRGPGGGCMTTAEISVAHPPLAKWLIAVGIRLFGFNSGGWRFAPFVAGTLSVAVLYLLARRLLSSAHAATLAAGLLAFDFLHFVLSRAAMLDVFVVCFGLVAFLCVVYDRDRAPPKRPAGTGLLARVGARPWLLGAGLAGGAAVACKWSGLYLLAAAALLALLWEGAAASPRPNGAPRRPAAGSSIPLLVAFVVVPVLLYVTSYAGRLEGTLLAWPWGEGSWLRAFVARQVLMFEHHSGALYTHPYMSSAWSWPLIKRPVLFYISEPAGGGYREILALGNPFVWWAGLLALLLAAWRLVRRRRVVAPEMVLLLGFAAGYLPWLIVTRREAFLYYFLPAVPFLYLALAQAAMRIGARAARAATTGLVAVAAVAPFALFWPLLTASPVSHAQWMRRMWFQDCGPAPSAAAGGPTRTNGPMTQVGTLPPSGWCWM